MTACKDSLNGKKAVSATLAGVLAVGMVPAAAFAADAQADTTDEAGISLQEATPQSAVEDGAIAAFADGAQAGASFTANGKAQGIIPTKVQPWGTTTEDAQKDVVEYVVMKVVSSTTTDAQKTTDRTINGKQFYYDKDATLYNQLPTAVGDYAVFAKVSDGANGTWSVKAGATFSIKAADIADAELYEVKSDATDLTDTEFVFDNTGWTIDGNKLGVKIGDTVVTDKIDTDSVEYYDAAANKLGAAPKKAGSYTAVLTTKAGSEYAGAKVKVPFEIKALDLADASIVVPDVVKATTGVNKADLSKVTVNGTAYANSYIDTYTTATFENLPITTGKATLTIAADEAALKADHLEGSIVNSQSVDYAVANYQVAVAATYGTDNFNGKTLATDFSADPTNAFDASKVAVSYTDPKTNKAVSTDKYTLRVTDTKTGKVGGAELLANKGTYTVEVVLDAEGLGYEYVGKNAPKMTVTVTKGNIRATDIAFAYEGKAIKTKDALKAEYTPDENIADDITVTVKTANGTVPESDYTVKLQKLVKDDYVDVDEITDAGTYRVSVEAEGYDVNADQNYINVVVGKRDLSKVQVRAKDAFVYSETDDKNTTEHRILTYTGEELAPSYEWSVDGKTWYDLPSADAKATYTQDGKTVKLLEVGTYTTAVAAAADSVNYDKSKTIWVEVSDKKVYSDVATDAWYGQVIYEATSLDYMNGYAGTSLFGPNDAITRGQVACVLYNMAGGAAADFNPHYDSNHGVVTGFSDVDGGQYYAAPIAWAKQAGVVNGYGDGTFAPDAKITREEFAAMLANYAALKGDDVAVDADAVLASFPDGSAVSGWAKDVVAWAAGNGIMGNGGVLNPTAQITRAEVAAMAVNYQPEKNNTIF